MTDPKSRVQLPSERIAELMSENRAPYAAIVRYLDERATVRPIAGGQEPVRHSKEEAGTFADWSCENCGGAGWHPCQDPSYAGWCWCRWCAVKNRDASRVTHPPASEPLTTMPRDYGQGFAHCGHGYAPGSPNCPHCHPTPENITYLVNSNRSLRDELAEAQAELTRLKEELSVWQGGAPGLEAERVELLAELTRIKAELTNSEASRTHYFDQSVERGVALSDAERTIAELKTDLAWEKGWDVCRKAQMGAVVEAALDILDSYPVGTYGPLRDALSALDRTDAEQTAKEWYHPELLTREVSSNSGGGSDNGT